MIKFLLLSFLILIGCVAYVAFGVIGYGIKPALAPTESNVRPKTAARIVPVVKEVVVPDEEITAYVTAYAAESVCAGKIREYCITANGDSLIEGVTIACPRKYPFGTRVRIGDAEKEYVCSDRTALKYDGRFDLAREETVDARNFGKQFLKVKVYLPK